MTSRRNIELVFDIELVNSDDAVLPSERTGPTCFRVTPYKVARPDLDVGCEVKFRVSFEPSNTNRRQQPYRENIAPEFPNGWKIGDPWTPEQDNLCDT
jgi:hypothetical protein